MLKRFYENNKILLNNILKLASGSFAAQIITIVASPISTRIFTAEELGIYTLILTAVTMFGPILSLRYDIAIVTAEGELETNAVIKLSFIINIFLSLVISLGYIYILNQNEEVKNSVGLFVFILIPIVFVKGLTNILMSYNNKYKQYGTMGRVQVIRAFSQNLIMIILGLFNFGSIALLLSQFIGNCFGLRKQAENLIIEFNTIIKTKIYDVKQAMNKYRQYPLFSTPAIFINSASYSLINFAITDLYGLEVFGYYSLTYRMLGLPITLIVTNVSKVFFQQASELRSRLGSYRKIYIKVGAMMGCFSLFMGVVLYLIAPIAFQVVFGDEWRISGEFVKILVPMYVIRMVASTLTPSFSISNKQNIELFLQSIFIICFLMVYMISKIYLFDIEVFLRLITISYGLNYVTFIFIMYRISNGKVTT